MPFVVWQMPGAVNGICAFTAAAAATVAAGSFRLTGSEWLFYFLLFLVMTMEMLNTALERWSICYAGVSSPGEVGKMQPPALLLAAVYAISRSLSLALRYWRALMFLIVS